jgi:glycine C-acetyltransferase
VKASKASAFLQFLEVETENLRQAGLLRPELELAAPQGPLVRIGDREFINFASSDYLGLASHREMKKASSAAVDAWGVGLASPRAAVGTVTLHRELERAIAKFLGAEDALVCASGHHADTGLFESLLGDRDYVFCDEMARPALADGIRLCRARAYAYRNNDMDHLEDRLKRSRAARFRIIATDGVFPMTGQVAKIAEIYALAAKYRATVVVDDSEALGVVGDRGEGTHGALQDGIDVVTGSFGYALGGGAGGFVAGRKMIVGWLRQKSRSHAASTALAPGAAAAARKAIELLGIEPDLRGALEANLRTFKEAMARDAGLLVEITHPATSVLVRNAVLAQRLADFLYRRGIYAIGYCHPVVPEGEARLCVRVTARHRKEDLEKAAKAIGDGMKELKIQL